MPGRRVARLIPLVATLVVMPGTALAHGPTECTSGPTRLASADTPHAVDAHGDGSAYGAAFGNTADIIGAWVSGPSAWEDRESTTPFAANIRVEALDRHPLLGRFYVVFDGADSIPQWVRAEADNPDMQWRFGYGHLEGTTYVRDGATTGSANSAAGTITINIPSTILPARPADGSAAALNLTEAESFLRLPQGVPGVTGNLLSVDVAAADCAVTLYEAAPVVV
ncbi:MAG TPA: hypothetical protein VG602_07315 [Actinomycetota bacterium]|nr:hypothetical protein [Actinomycetota bacterium]